MSVSCVYIRRCFLNGSGVGRCRATEDGLAWSGAAEALLGPLAGGGFLGRWKVGPKGYQRNTQIADETA